MINTSNQNEYIVHTQQRRIERSIITVSAKINNLIKLALFNVNYGKLKRGGCVFV